MKLIFFFNIFSNFLGLEERALEEPVFSISSCTSEAIGKTTMDGKSKEPKDGIGKTFYLIS